MNEEGWRARWLSPDGYLGLHLVVGFLIAIVAGILFRFVAGEVFSSPTAIAADASAQDFATSIASPFLNQVALAAAFVGSTPVLTVLSLAVAGALLKAGAKRRLAAFLATMIGGPLLNVAMKNYFQRPRPDESLWLGTASGFSFPSGHSMGSMLFFGALAYVVFFTFERHRIERWVAVALCPLAILTIGASRIYLHVHYFSDVIAGFLGGLFWIGVSISGVEGWVRIRNRRRRDVKAS